LGFVGEDVEIKRVNDLDELEALHRNASKTLGEAIFSEDSVSVIDFKFYSVCHKKLPELIAELRAAREVIDEARFVTKYSECQHNGIKIALREYDKTVNGDAMKISDFQAAIKRLGN
jgi:hypothetical protein